MAELHLEAFLPYRLNRLAAAISQEFQTVYGRHHALTIPEWRVLATLGEFEPITAKEVGQHSSMHKTKVSRAVRALEQRRWVKRRVSEMDRREELLGLTNLGRKSYSEIVPKAVAFEARLLHELGPHAPSFLSSLYRLELTFTSQKHSRRRLLE